MAINKNFKTQLGFGENVFEGLLGEYFLNYFARLSNGVERLEHDYGKIYYAKGDLDLALKYAKKEKNCKILEKIYVDKGMYKENIGELNKICKNYKPETLYHFYNAKKYDEFIKLYKKQKRMPSSSYFYEFSKIYFKRGEYEKAAKYLKKGIESNWFCMKKLELLKDCYLKLENKEKAEFYQKKIDALKNEV